ncbi:sensor histidine kinase [Curtobacterium sp. ZW137]|uniref:sensor histidine kinase n=1 Tax=Curtobacterium sp. ZW137 TaxID=2485104 RepID=UPI000F4C809F|nr:histidine kinase [Curtobacterium sp. ZW137]ROP63305.1 signal transduction histidine kinase [Curtobacterium sp. ZW137]
MTLLSGDDPTDLSGGRSRSRLGWSLSAVGIVAVGFWFVKNGVAMDLPAWVWVIGTVALAAWAVREFLRTPWTTVVAAAVMVVAGAAVVVSTDALMLAPVIVGVVVLQASPRLPVWSGTVAVLVALVEIAVSAAAAGTAVLFVLASCGGLVLGVLVGFSRRQFRFAEAQARQAERDQARAELLADRSRAARDIHDVLAHSLGGLVLQLDAVEALLEAGRVDEATRRAADARTLAADGLAEARRAVHALRDDDDTRDHRAGGTDAPEPTRASRPDAPDTNEAPDANGAPETNDAPSAPGLPALVAAHRSFGGQVLTQGDLTLADLDDAHRTAVVAASREALSNARRHAPGCPVSLSVIRDGDAVDVVLANPLSSGGHGLIGMRERFAELSDGATIDADRSDDEFVVAMHLPVAGEQLARGVDGDR